MKEITFWAAFTAIIFAVVLLVASFHLNDILLFTGGAINLSLALTFHALFNMYTWKQRYEEIQKKKHN